MAQPADRPDFGTRLVILDAVNGVRPLNGTPGLDTNIPVLTEVFHLIGDCPNAM